MTVHTQPQLTQPQTRHTQTRHTQTVLSLSAELPRPNLRMLRSAMDLLTQARAGLSEADRLDPAAERYATAHLAALRAAAAVLAARARSNTGASRGRLRSAWDLLAEVTPELAEWATFFAAGAAKRAAAESGVSRAVTAREADDLVRDVQIFLAVVATTIGANPSR